MEVHIGRIIKDLVKRKGISVTEFAIRINCTRRNAYEIFEKETIDTGLLQKISKVLEVNLFVSYVSEEEVFKIKSNKTTHEELKEIVFELKNEVERLKEISFSKKSKS